MRDPDRRRSNRTRLARAAIERLSAGRAGEIDEAIERAARELGLDRRADRPTRRELRAHAQAFEESQVGLEGRLRRIADALDEAVRVMTELESIVARDDAPDRPPPLAFGRIVRGELDLDPSASLRVTTAISCGRLAGALEDRGWKDVACGSIPSRYGRLDELRFDGEHASFHVIRIPPRMRVDPDLDLVHGRRIERADAATLARLRDRMRPSGS